MFDTIVVIHNVETNEVVEREMSAEELIQREAEELAAHHRADEIAQQSARKTEILERLGLTEDEAKLILS